MSSLLIYDILLKHKCRITTKEAPLAIVAYENEEDEIERERERRL